MMSLNKKVALALLSITTLISLNTVAFSSMDVAYDDYVRVPDIAAPVPADDDVIKHMGFPTSSQLPARSFKFLVWNLHKGTEERFKPEYLALSFDRDIVMNQEVFLDQKMTGVFNYLPHFFFTTATSFFSGKEKVRTGVANISRVQPSHTLFIRTKTLEPVVGSPKLALITSYPIRFSTHDLTVVNIHGINFVSTRSFQQELARIYELIKDVKGPLVFAGDFNTWNLERTKILEHYAQKLGLSHARFLPDNRMTFNGYPLDHFLHSKDLKVSKAKVEGFYRGSDHKPLQVEVEYFPLATAEEDQHTQDTLASH